MKKSAFLALAGTTLALTTAAMAQPAVDLDLGTLTNGAPASVNTIAGFAIGQIKWVKFTIPAGNMTRAAGQFLDITLNGGTYTGGDTQMGLYNSVGARVGYDDDDGPSLYSQLSYGDTSPARAAIAFTGNATANGATRTGIDGADLPAGDYYLAIGPFSSTFSTTTPWGVTTTNTTRSGDVNIRVELGTDTTPTNPTGVGTMSTYVLTGGTAHFKVQVTNGTFPTSTYANPGSGVTVDTTLIGGGVVSLFDDGAHNDGAAGDGNWGADVVVGAAAGSYTMPFAILDDQARTGSGNMAALVVAPAAPTCPPGTGAVSFSGLSSAAAVGSANNSILPGSALGWTSTNPLLAIHVSGRMREVNTGTFASESRLHVTFTDLTTTDLQPSTVGGYTGYSDVVNKVFTLTPGHNVNQIQSIEFFESLDDGADGLIDATWDSICFTYDSQTSPTGVAAATPNSGLAGASTVLTCTVTPGQGPVSSGITVNADLSQIGGGASVAMFDDGLSGGDVTAGDNIFTYTATVGAVGGGAKTINFAIADAELRSGSASTTFTVTAPPSVFTDLGTITCVPQNLTVAGLAANEVRWYKFIIPAINNVPNNFLDIYTTTASTLSSGDTELGLYDNTGAIAPNGLDDDGAAGAYSVLTYGSTVARTSPEAGTVLNGNDGTLAAGTYWLAVGAFNTTYLAGWNATSTSTATGDIDLHLVAVDSSCTTPPAGVGSLTPSSIQSGANVHFGVVVTPGTVPTSTFATGGVVVDGTLIGAGSIQLFDDGAHNDGAAGDLNYGADQIVSAADGAYVLPFTVTDDQARVGAGNMPTLNIVPAAPSCPPGSGAASFTNIDSVDGVGAVGNVTIPGASLGWTSTDPLLNIHVSGRLQEVATATFASEARFLVTFSDSSTLVLQPFTTTGFTGFVDVADYAMAVPAGHPANSIVSIEAYESFVDAAGSADATWLNLCFSYDTTTFTPPTGVGTGGSVNGCGGTVLATVAVTPGDLPPSTGLAVTLDTAAIGGGVVSMFDNGTNGDVTANDNIFSLNVAIAGGADATFNFPFAITDAESRSGSGSLNIVRSASEIGDLPSSAQTYYGAAGTTITGTIGGGTDVDMFAICVADTANFEASVNNGGAAFDTQLFLFNADGTGAAMNDDEPDVAGTLQSHLMLNNSLQLTPDPIVLPAGGLYYLAISPYNRDPITSGVATDTIWANTGGLANSFDETWTPNGVTPTLPVVGWTNTGNTGGAYTITLVGGTTTCPADLSDSSGAHTPDCAVDINDLLWFLGAFEAGNADLDNGTGSGVQDCATDINDLLFFLTHFEAGC